MRGNFLLECKGEKGLVLRASDSNGLVIRKLSEECFESDDDLRPNDRNVHQCSAVRKNESIKKWRPNYSSGTSRSVSRKMIYKIISPEQAQSSQLTSCKIALLDVRAVSRSSKWDLKPRLTQRFPSITARNFRVAP
ncbi:MAG: hypothetical protein JWR19_1281 [Pedosphaera sp.]|nr:hypothetical protein [Pedosphaera sp.]